MFLILCRFTNNVDIMNNKEEKRIISEAIKDNPLTIVDNGHGRGTPGKSSPDGRHREWEWTRRAARRLVGELTARGLDAVLLVPEDDDLPLRERCRRADALAAGRRAVLLSLHNNAAGDGTGWHGANGFSAFAAPRAGVDSCRLARIFVELARARGLCGNRAIPAEGFWRGNFAIVRDVAAPAVLAENMFMDNRADAAFLASEAGMERLVGLHVDALLKFFNSVQ